MSEQSPGLQPTDTAEVTDNLGSSPADRLKNLIFLVLAFVIKSLQNITVIGGGIAIVVIAILYAFFKLIVGS